MKYPRKLIRTALRPVVLAWLWSNRRDVARWAKFAKRASSSGTRPSAADLRLEARVRASLSTDPILRNDPSLRDVRVHDGTVVLETPADWHNRSLAVARLTQLDGVEAVHTAAEADETNFLRVQPDDIDPRFERLTA